MDALAKELLQQINDICIGYHYFRQTDAVKRGIELLGKVQQFTSGLLGENIFNVEESEQADFQNYVLQVLSDYSQAAIQRDLVLMIDALDYGMRELVNIFTETDDEERADG